MKKQEPDENNVLFKSKESDAVKKYKYSQAMTAGKIQTLILLIEKMQNLIRKIDLKNIQSSKNIIIQCQNIIAQLEMALNFRKGTSTPEILELFELMYTALSIPNKQSLYTVTYLLKHFKETLRMKFQ